jgi:hypothetical protein
VTPMAKTETVPAPAATPAPVSPLWADIGKVQAPPIFMRNRYIAAHGIKINPLFCPEGIKVAWATKEGDEGIEALKNRGYTVARKEHVTRNEDEARDKGLIALLEYTEDAAGLVRLNDIYLMFTRQDWYENRLKEKHRLARERAQLSAQADMASVGKENQGALEALDRRSLSSTELGQA